MMQLTLAVAELFRKLDLRTEIQENEMELVDTFNGAPKTPNLWVSVNELGVS